MRLWYLDNSYTSYVIAADTGAEAWGKLRAQEGILPPLPDDYSPGVMSGEDDAGMLADGLTNAYYDIVEVTPGFRIDGHHDLRFVL